jgi:hypothetical protein
LWESTYLVWLSKNKALPDSPLLKAVSDGYALRAGAPG